MIRQVALALSLAAVSGCSAMPYYSQLKAVAETGIETAVEDRKSFNDKKAEVYRVGAGDISRGAMLRVYSPDEQCAIDTLILHSVPEWCKNDDELKQALNRLSDTLEMRPQPLE